MRYLLFRGDPAGMSNVKMGLDIGVGLAHLTNRVLVLYENDPLWEGARPIAGRPGTAPCPTILDLFDVPVPLLGEECLVPALPDLSLHRCSWSDLADAIYHPPDVALEGPLFESFRNGRRYAYTIDEALDRHDVIQIDSRPLAHYSHFFYVPDRRRDGLLRAMEGVRAKQPYRDFARDFADAFAKDMGPFNAVHLRRTDTMKTTPRNAKVTGEEVVANLSPVFPAEQSLLICTDESSDTEFFAPILRAYPVARFLDRLILDDPSSAARLRALPYAGDPVLALVTQLVATYAERFAGSFISTFTALVQRMRGQRNPREPFLFAYDQFAGHARAAFRRLPVPRRRSGALLVEPAPIPVSAAPLLVGARVAGGVLRKVRRTGRAAGSGQRAPAASGPVASGWWRQRDDDERWSPQSGAYTRAARRRSARAGIANAPAPVCSGSGGEAQT